MSPYILKSPTTNLDLSEIGSLRCVRYHPTMNFFIYTTRILEFSWYEDAWNEFRPIFIVEAPSNIYLFHQELRQFAFIIYESIGMISILTGISEKVAPLIPSLLYTWSCKDRPERKTERFPNLLRQEVQRPG